MTPNPDPDLKKIIDEYDQTIKEVRENPSDLDPYDRVTPATPIYLQYQADYLCDYLDVDDGSDEVKEVRRIKSTTNDLVTSTDSYLRAVISELDKMVEQYPKYVGSAFELEPISNEIDQTLYTRDNIEMILSFFLEMSDSPLHQINEDIRECRIRVSALDKALRRRFELHDDLVREDQEIYRKEYYPDNYWWRHPEQVLD